MRGFRLFYTAAVAIASLTATVIVIGWLSMGGRIFSVQTGSMRPVIKSGDAVLLQSHTLIRPGDIVSYRDPRTGIIITHRFVGYSGGQLKTKGDANNSIDPLIPKSAVIGKATYVAPYLGTVMSWLRKPLGLLIALYIPAAVVLYWLIRSLQRPSVHYQWR